MTEPTDAEIVALADATRTAEGGANGYILPISFARAVLAKWGTPAGAGEVVACGNCGGTGWMVRDPDIGTDRECFVCNGEGYSESATPQPTQAQAGEVPLTDEELYDEKRSAIPQLFDLAQQWADNKIHSYQFANEAEKIVNAVARRVEAAHGIKGGQHGTD